MPGFGSGPFGGGAFGEFNWSKNVLFRLAPEIHRTNDVDGLFELYAEAQGVSFDTLRRKIRAYEDLRSPREIRTAFDEIATLRLGVVTLLRDPVEQSGLLATVDANGTFLTGRARFTQDDLGKELTISGSSLEANNASVLITSVTSFTSVLTSPPLTPDAGPLRWEVRPLQTSTQQQTVVEVVGGDVQPINPGWILSDGTTEFTVLRRTQFKAASDERKLLTLREGSDGSIVLTAPLAFTTSFEFALETLTGNFVGRDVGRRVTLANAQNFQNNGQFEIVDVVSSKQAVLSAPSGSMVLEGTGQIFWALMRTPELILEGSGTLRGVAEQRGEDGELSDAGTAFIARSATFDFDAAIALGAPSDDEGKLITYSKAGEESATVEIVTVKSATEVEVVAPPTVVLGTGFHWELRSPTDLGDETQVEVRAPGLLRFLSQDFGIEVDEREEEETQRRWVDSVNRWINRKGEDDAYKILGALTEFETTDVSEMYRVTQDIYESALASGAEAHAVGESADGRSGTDGALALVSGSVEFSSATAVFTPGDTGRQIEVDDTGTFGNQGIRTIVEVITASKVRFRSVDTMIGTLDDNFGSGVTWRIIRLYSEQAPLLPSFDVINLDRMQEFTGFTATAGVTDFTVDMYCWETSPVPWSTKIGVNAVGIPNGLIDLLTVDPAVGAVTPTVYTITARGDFDVIVGIEPGFWKLTDSGGVAHFIETVPVLGGSPITIADGSLTGVSPARFTSPTASFTAGDVGKRLRIELSGSGNDRLGGANGDDLQDSYIIAAFVSGTEVDLHLSHVPTTPDANNGGLGWSLHEIVFTTVATAPPALGGATLEYVCPVELSCNYCKSSKVLVEATTDVVLEDPFEQLAARLEQTLPAHAELVQAFGMESEAVLSLVADLDSP
jgi:hypothetical protein